MATLVSSNSRGNISQAARPAFLLLLSDQLETECTADLHMLRKARPLSGLVSEREEMKHLKNAVIQSQILEPFTRTLPSNHLLLDTFFRLSSEVLDRVRTWQPTNPYSEAEALHHPDPRADAFLMWFPSIHTRNYDRKVAALRGLIIGQSIYVRLLYNTVIPSIVAARYPDMFKAHFNGKHEPIELRCHPPLYLDTQAWVGMAIEGREYGDFADVATLYRTDKGMNVLLR
jgi:hypothetical protein